MESSWNPALRPDSREPYSQYQIGQNLAAGHAASGGENEQRELRSVQSSRKSTPENDEEALPSQQGIYNSVPGQELNSATDENAVVGNGSQDDATGANTALGKSDHVDVGNQGQGLNYTVVPTKYDAFSSNGGSRHQNAESATKPVVDTSDFFDYQSWDVTNIPREAEGNIDIDRAFAAEARDFEQPWSSNPQKTEPFPEVPPFSKAASFGLMRLPKSQAEAIVGECDDATLQTAPLSSSASIESPTINWDDSEAFATRNDNNDLFTGIGNVEVNAQGSAEEEEDARFEEGLPLVPTLDKLDTVENQNPKVYSENDNAGRKDVSAFFDNGSHSVSSSNHQPPNSLDRKSTMQVLDSLQFAPHEINNDSTDKNELLSTLSGSLGEETSNLEERVEPAANAARSAEKTGVEPKDDDLSDLWRAALGEDDMLDENDQNMDLNSFFNDDGEGFLEDLADAETSQTQLAASVIAPPLRPGYDSNSGALDTDRSPSIATRPSNPYMPNAGASLPSSSNQRGQPHMTTSLLNTASAVNTYPYAPHNRQRSAEIPKPSRPQLRESAQSFVDKSRGGYKSPYDLPMDVTRPRKRAAPLPVTSIAPKPLADGRPPPPRRDSIRSSHMTPSIEPVLPDHNPIPVKGRPGSAVVKSKPDMGSFFEELPSSKPRPSSSAGRPALPTSQTTPPPTSSQVMLPPRSSYGQGASSDTPSIAQDYQLLPPERLNLFGDNSSRPPSRQVAPVMNSRYSPAPFQASSVPPPLNRYASSTVVAPRPPSTHAIPHQPRTSSPLTQTSMNSQQHFPSVPSNSYDYTHTTLLDRQPPQQRYTVNENQPVQSSGNQLGDRTTLSPLPGTEPPPPLSINAAPSSSSPSTPSHAVYTPGLDQSSPDLPLELGRGPPRRSQTQSPNVARSSGASTGTRIPYQRPASVDKYAPQPASHELPIRRATADRYPTTQLQSVEYIRPSDGRELDDLERWKGCPLFRFGFGGKVVKMFPQRIPRYAAGQKVPLMKCSPGEVKIESEKVSELQDTIATFPGPLKAKGKKKEVLDWLRKKLVDMDSGGFEPTNKGQTLPNPIKCREERILLWKLMEILVEHDGALDGNKAAEQAVRAVLSPELNQGDAAQIPQNDDNAPLIGITKRSGPHSVLESGQAGVLEEVRKLLLHGNRDQAVWHAVDNRLWAHAMLISSTLGQDTRKQVAQEFVRQEVKIFAENTESLSALYQIFAGNWEESVDELVPPSARAGLQMVSKSASTGPTKNALDGLDRWRETLTLILSNRTADDGKALVALGQLLAGYGRTEAAHICYIFAKTSGLFGGPDDPQVSVALLGADHIRRPFDYGRDFDSILLTEVHDFTRTVLSSSSVSTMSPHLQSYRLFHAMTLAEYGFRAEAQQYCDAISITLKSTTKPSPYYHSLLISTLETLQDRLRQAPHDASGSWMSKPSIDKVSGSIWAKFNSYVAGDEDDTASTGSGNVHDPAAGPFAGVAGDSSEISRTPSSADLHNTYGLGMGYTPIPPAMTSSYASVGVYTPRSSLEQPRQLTSDSPKTTSNETLRPGPLSHQYSSRPTSSAGANSRSYVSPPQPSPYAPRTQIYLPTPPLQPDIQAGYTPQHYNDQEAYAPTSLSEPTLAQENRQLDAQAGPPNSSRHPPFQSEEHTELSYKPNISYQPPQEDNPWTLEQKSYEPTSYEPPAMTYEPPSPYEPPSSSYGPSDDYNEVSHSESSPVERKPRRFITELDNEEDFEARAAALRRVEKARKDREADESFKKAAEEDAQRDKAPKLNSKKSWFGGGWFNSSKEKANENGTPNAPIKVKLGEESSFYFDKDIGKWVNKKGGSTESAAVPAPPPPRGPPSRAVSAAAGPPMRATATPPVPPLPAGMGASGPPIRAVSGPSLSQALGSSHPSRTSSPALNSAQKGDDPAPAFKTPSAPPSRPATGQGGANEVDDLYGIPQARKGGTVKKGKKGRGYVDVMVAK